MFTALAAAPAASAALAHWGGGPGFGILFFLIPLFWIGLVVLIVALFGRRWRRAAAANGYGPGSGVGPGFGGPWGHHGWVQHHAARTAEATLAERFAQGDIDEKEYRARLEVLRASVPQPPAPPAPPAR